MNSVSNVESNEDWDRIIEPTGSLGHRPIRQLWNHRDLLWLLVRRDVVSFYKQTVFGPLWFFIQPLLLTGIYILVFGRIAGIPTDGAPQFLFYFCGISLWNYVNECVLKSSSVFRDNADLFGKVYFPRILLPMSIVVSSLIKFVIQFGLFLVLLVYYELAVTHLVSWHALLLPIVLLNLMGLSFAMGTLLSASAAKYRDLLHVLPFGLQLLMFATPIIYPLSTVPSGVAPFLKWNPFTPLFETARAGLLGAGTVSYGGLAYATIFTVCLLFVSTKMFHRVERTVVDTI